MFTSWGGGIKGELKGHDGSIIWLQRYTFFSSIILFVFKYTKILRTVRLNQSEYSKEFRPVRNMNILGVSCSPNCQSLKSNFYNSCQVCNLYVKARNDMKEPFMLFDWKIIDFWG